MTSKLHRALPWLVGLGVAGGCSDAANRARPATPFTIWLFDERLTLDGEVKPIAHARVAFDPPGGGERITRTTEADGHVTFDGDFGLGGGSVTVLSDAHVFTTWLEASPETARARPNTMGKPESDLVGFPLRLDRAAESETVELRGSIVGKADAHHVVSLSTTALARLGTYTAFESAYVLRAPRDRPFSLFGLVTSTVVDRDQVVVENELLKSFRIDLPARSDDQLLDLDLPKLPALPTTPIHVRAELPTGTSSFGDGARAFASVRSVDSGISVGSFARARRSSDGGSFDIDVTLVDTDVAPERLFSEAILQGADGSQSSRAEVGGMVDGFLWKDFALPPSVPNPDASRTARDPIPVEGIADGAELLAKVYAGGGQLLWVLHGPPGGLRAKTFAIPYRDEVGSVDVQLFALSVSARSGRVALPGRGEVYRYTSTFRDIVLRKR